MWKRNINRKLYEIFHKYNNIVERGKFNLCEVNLQIINVKFN